jgi:hypothetical protein
MIREIDRNARKRAAKKAVARPSCRHFRRLDKNSAIDGFTRGNSELP